MAPRLAWVQMCLSDDLTCSRSVDVRPPLTRKRIVAAAARKFSSVSKGCRAYNGSTGAEIIEELAAEELEQIVVVLCSSGCWDGTGLIHEVKDQVLEPPPQPDDRSEDAENHGPIELAATKLQQAVGSQEVVNFSDYLADELLVRLCFFLPAPELLCTGCVCRAWFEQSLHCVELWRALCEELLGPTLLQAHRLLHTTSHNVTGVFFYRSLIQAAFRCESFQYAYDLRKSCVNSMVGSESEEVDESDLLMSALMKRHLLASGHTATAMEHLVVHVGGWRKRRAEDDLHLCVVDYGVEGGPCLHEPTLAAGSARPPRRLRHSCCVVRPDFLAESFNCPELDGQALLVLGGCHDRTHEPLPGLHHLVLLTFTRPDGSEACWHIVEASGNAPSAIWHHACGSFAAGKRVVVFGGDFPESDPEFAYIQDRMTASVVYVLDVDARCWDRVETTGMRPSWRSLHIGTTHKSLKDASERLVVFGGCAEHIEIFSSGDAVDMCGYALDLSSWNWLRGPTSSEFSYVPEGRMRVAAERVGRFLLVYGGHGNGDERKELRVCQQESLLKLNLLTLSWDTAAVTNSPYAYANVPAATLAGGVISGGVQMTPSAVRAVPKLDFLLLDFNT